MICLLTTRTVGWHLISVAISASQSWKSLQPCNVFANRIVPLAHADSFKFTLFVRSVDFSFEYCEYNVRVFRCRDSNYLYLQSELQEILFALVCVPFVTNYYRSDETSEPRLSCRQLYLSTFSRVLQIHLLKLLDADWLCCFATAMQVYKIIETCVVCGVGILRLVTNHVTCLGRWTAISTSNLVSRPRFPTCR